MHSKEYFLKIIDKLSWNSACGPDGITTMLIKRLREPMAIFLSNLHNTSMRRGEFPRILKHAFVIGIYKGGEKFLAKNYRPISLTSHLSKVVERAVRSDIVEFLDDWNMWDPRQHGSRSGRSTLSQLIEHQNSIIEALEDGYNMEMV